LSAGVGLAAATTGVVIGTAAASSRAAQASSTAAYAMPQAANLRQSDGHTCRRNELLHVRVCLVHSSLWPKRTHLCQRRPTARLVTALPIRKEWIVALV
jgi:hypothetical protein